MSAGAAATRGKIVAEDPFPRWLLHMAIGRRAHLLLAPRKQVQFLTMTCMTTLHNTAADVPRVIPGRQQGGGCKGFYDIDLEITRHHFSHILYLEASC